MAIEVINVTENPIEDIIANDTHLEQIVGQIGARQAGKVIRRRIYDAIAKVYPEYAEECQRQMQARYGESPEVEKGL